VLHETTWLERCLKSNDFQAHFHHTLSWKTLSETASGHEYCWVKVADVVLHDTTWLERRLKSNDF